MLCRLSTIMFLISSLIGFAMQQCCADVSLRDR
jgi:hypothetical protein